MIKVFCDICGTTEIDEENKTDLAAAFKFPLPLTADRRNARQNNAEIQISIVTPNNDDLALCFNCYESFLHRAIASLENRPRQINE